MRVQEYTVEEAAGRLVEPVGRVHAWSDVQIGDMDPHLLETTTLQQNTARRLVALPLEVHISYKKVCMLCPISRSVTWNRTSSFSIYYSQASS